MENEGRGGKGRKFRRKAGLRESRQAGGQADLGWG